MSKPIEENANKLEFRRKLEVEEPVLLTVDASEYQISDIDFGATLVILADGININLSNLFVPSNQGKIKILNGSTSDFTLTLGVDVLNLDGTVSVTGAIVAPKSAVYGFELFFGANGWQMRTIAARTIEGLDALNAGGGAVVGEIITASSGAVTDIVDTNTAYGVIWVDLPAGWWEISGWGAINCTGGSCTSRRFGISTDGAAIGSNLIVENTYRDDNTLVTQTKSMSASIGPVIVNPATLTTYNLYAAVTKTAGTFNALGRLTARRFK